MFRIFNLICVLTLLPVVATAQWVSDSTTNTPVCVLSSSTQTYPNACTDESDGAIIVWQDTRNGGGNTVYAQRLGADGRPKWTANGVRLVRGSNASQTYPKVASDGKGGAYVVWQDLRNSGNGIDLYAQHISPTGGILWDSVGRPVAYNKGDQTNQQIVADGFGNAFVVWEDNNSSINQTNPDIYMNRLSPTKVMWDTMGAVLTSEDNRQLAPQLCDDGKGGFFAAWESDNGTPSSIHAQRVDSNANRLWGTSPNGITVFKLIDAQNAKNVSIRRDGTQAMLAWEYTGASSNSQDISATRLTSAGVNMYPFNQDIDVTGSTVGDQIHPQVFSDDSTEVGNGGNSGLVVLFENNYSIFPQQIQAVRVFANGTSVTPPNGNFGYPVSYDKGAEGGYSAVRVAPGSILTAWNDRRADSSIYCQRVDRTLVRGFHATGTPLLWGQAVSNRKGTQAKQVTLAPRTSGAIAAWTDYRNGNADIYAQLIFKDGSLPVELETFQATCQHIGEVNLEWKTASEHGNAGFEIERRVVDGAAENSYSTISSYSNESALRGAGNSDIERSYAFIDRGVAPAIYEYRLAEVALDGTRTTHNPVRVDARSGESVDGWSIGTGNITLFESQSLPISVASDALVDVSISDVTGRVIANPVQHEHWTTGLHELAMNSSQFPSSGNFFLQLTAYDPSTGAVLWRNSRATIINAIK